MITMSLLFLILVTWFVMQEGSSFRSSSLETSSRRPLSHFRYRLNLRCYTLDMRKFPVGGLYTYDGPRFLLLWNAIDVDTGEILGEEGARLTHDLWYRMRCGGNETVEVTLRQYEDAIIDEHAREQAALFCDENCMWCYEPLSVCDNGSKCLPF